MKFKDLKKEKYDKVADIILRAIMLDMLEGIMLNSDDVDEMMNWEVLDEDDYFDIIRVLDKLYSRDDVEEDDE